MLLLFLELLLLLLLLLLLTRRLEEGLEEGEEVKLSKVCVWGAAAARPPPPPSGIPLSAKPGLGKEGVSFCSFCKVALASRLASDGVKPRVNTADCNMLTK